MAEEKLLSMMETADTLGMTYDGVVQAIRSRRIKNVVKVNRRNFFYAQEIEDFRKRREAKYATRG